MSTSALSLPKRLTIGTAAFALLAAGVASTLAGPASAHGSGSSGSGGGPTATATVVSPTGTGSSTTTFTGASTTLSIKISNTKTAIKSFSISAPSSVTDFAQVAGSPTGWNQSQGTCSEGQQCLKYTATANKYWVGNGANGSVTFTITFTAPSTVGPFSLKAQYYSDSDWHYGIGSSSLGLATTGYPSTVDGWCITTPSGVSAGAQTTFSAQARVQGASTSTDPCAWTNNSAFAGGAAAFDLAVADASAVTSISPTTLPQSASGSYSFTATFTKATAAQAITITAGGATTTSAAFGVSAQASTTTLSLSELSNGTVTGTTFTSGDTVSGTVSASDGLGNAVALDPTQVTVTRLTGDAAAFSSSVAAGSTAGTATVSVRYTGTGTTSFSVSYPGITSVGSGTLTFAVGAPASLSITSFQDSDGNTLFSGDIVNIGFQVEDANGNPIDVSGNDVAITSVTSGTTGTFYKTGAGTNTVSGYWNAAEQVTLKVAYSSTVYATTTQTFIFQDATNGGQFSPFTPASVSTNSQNGDTTCQDSSQSCATVDLTNGANGTVNVTNTGSQITIDGNFKNPADGTPLYTNAQPMVVHYNCPESQCPLGGMPNNNGVIGSPSVGDSCYSGSGTVFTYPVTLEPYCVVSSPKESIEAAQSYHFEDALGTNPADNLIRYACQVDGSGKALLLNMLDTSATYSPATEVPLHGQNGENLYSCLDVTSIDWTVTGAGTANPSYTINYVILAADDYVTKLR